MKCYDIAVITTCFNRKNLTLRCIEVLSKPNSRYSTSFYICDDASTDGTTEAIKREYPFVNIVMGSGSLFWCRGMYYAMKEAVMHKHDLYLMVNDDVEFHDNSIEEMLNTYEMGIQPCGVVGYTLSKIDGFVTYCGYKGKCRKILGKNAGFVDQVPVISTEEKLETCQLTNWNCFMVDANTIERIGLIDKVYEHGIGDYDYSLMMEKAGIPVYVTRHSVGFCERNSTKKTFQDNSLSRWMRLKMLFSPKAYPVRSRFHYGYKHFGLRGVVFTIMTYIHLVKDIIVK